MISYKILIKIDLFLNVNLTQGLLVKLDIGCFSSVNYGMSRGMVGFEK